MATTSTTFPLTVTGAAETVLEKIVSAMQAQSTGVLWSYELSAGAYELANNHPDHGTGPKINDVIGWNGGSGSEADGAQRRCWMAYGVPGGSIHVLPGDGGPAVSHWDEQTKSWWHCSGTTGRAPYSQTLVRYRAATDEFRHWQGSAQGSTDGPFDPYGGAHSFFGSCMDTAGRKYYRILSNDNLNTWQLWSVSLDDPFTRTMVGAPFPVLVGKYLSIEFHPLIGSAGSILLLWHNEGIPRAFTRFDVATSQIESDLTPSPTMWGIPSTTYCNGAVYGVASRSPNSVFFKIGADKVVNTSLAPPPVLMNGDADSDGNIAHTELAALGTKIYAFWAGDPSSDGGVYVYDTVADQWQADPIDTLPDTLPKSSNNHVAYTLTPVESLGCVLFAYYVNDTTDRALVWKPPA